MVAHGSHDAALAYARKADNSLGYPQATLSSFLIAVTSVVIERAQVKKDLAGRGAADVIASWSPAPLRGSLAAGRMFLLPKAAPSCPCSGEIVSV